MRLTKLARRRKTILGAVLGFGAVALLTTGAASYIISVSNPTTDKEIGVTVDTVQRQFVELVVPDSSLGIKLGETSSIEADSNAVGAESIEKNSLELNLGAVKVTYGKDFLDVEQKLQLQFSLSYDGGKNANNLVSTALLPDIHSNELKTTNGSWTYVDAPVALDVPTATVGGTVTVDNQDAEGLTVVTWTNLKVSFQWGSFWQTVTSMSGTRLSPAQFYNSHFYKTGDSSGRQLLTLETAQQIAKELEGMQSLKNLTLTISAAAASK